MSNNEQRDELARDIAAALGGGNASVRAITNVADSLIAAGYRKPRTITTVEELDALPAGSVVLDRGGMSLHKQNVLGMWNASNCTLDVQREEIEQETFPATVIHEPTTEATK